MGDTETTSQAAAVTEESVAPKKPSKAMTIAKTIARRAILAVALVGSAAAYAQNNQEPTPGIVVNIDDATVVQTDEDGSTIEFRMDDETIEREYGGDREAASVGAAKIFMDSQNGA